jgi:hypothetical protein
VDLGFSGKVLVLDLVRGCLLGVFALLARAPLLLGGFHDTGLSLLSVLKLFILTTWVFHVSHFFFGWFEKCWAGTDSVRTDAKKDPGPISVRTPKKTPYIRPWKTKNHKKGKTQNLLQA